MNKRKEEQARRNASPSKGRRRIIKALRGGRTVVASPEHIALIGLMRPQIPWHVKAKLDARFDTMQGEDDLAEQIADHEAAMREVGVEPIANVTEPEPVEVAVKEHRHWRENNRRRQQWARLVRRNLRRALEAAS